MVFKMSREERDLLVALIDREIRNMGPEIRHTQTSTYRDELMMEKRQLNSLVERLRQADNVTV